MTTSALAQAGLAETLSRDQLNQLAAVMLGLVVFAAIFALVERLRRRRGSDDEESAAPSIDPPRSTAPPRYVSDTPAVAITTPPLPPTTPGVEPDDLPVPFVPRAHDPAAEESSTAGAEPTSTPPAAPVPAPGPAAPEGTWPGETALPQFPPAEQAPGSSPPASPDEIGIIIPDEPSPPGS